MEAKKVSFSEKEVKLIKLAIEVFKDVSSINYSRNMELDKIIKKLIIKK